MHVINYINTEISTAVVYIHNNNIPTLNNNLVLSP